MEIREGDEGEGDGVGGERGGMGGGDGGDGGWAKERSDVGENEGEEFGVDCLRPSWR